MKNHYCADTYCFAKVENHGDLCEDCKQEKETEAEPYVKDAPVDYPPSIFSQIKKHNLEVITPADVSKHEKPKRKTQRQKQAEIDGLLDELNVLKTVIDICGTDEDYAVRIADVKRKLKEATA